MPNRPDRTATLIEILADHILANGLGSSSLRPLAAAAKTSDRMLLYYFADKDALMATLLERVAMKMLVALETELPDRTQRPADELTRLLWQVTVSEDFRPYMVVWLEVATLAARHAQPYRRIASQIAQGFLEWVELRLEAGPGEDRYRLAAEVLTRIDGALLMDALGRRDIADASFG